MGFPHCRFHMKIQKAEQVSFKLTKTNNEVSLTKNQMVAWNEKTYSNLRPSRFAAGKKKSILRSRKSWVTTLLFSWGWLFIYAKHTYLAIWGNLFANWAFCAVPIVEPSVPECVSHAGSPGQREHGTGRATVEHIRHVNKQIHKTGTKNGQSNNQIRIALQLACILFE